MKKLKIRPTGHHVLVKPEKMKKISEGGIFLPEDMVSRENTAKVRGEIVAVGENSWKAFDNGEPWAEVGDKVYFKRHVSDIIEDESDIDESGDPQKYFLLVDENILAVIEE
jgi:co-chaperonin GroES (HSP10)